MSENHSSTFKILEFFLIFLFLTILFFPDSQDSQKRFQIPIRKFFSEEHLLGKGTPRFDRTGTATGLR